MRYLLRSSWCSEGRGISRWSHVPTCEDENFLSAGHERVGPRGHAVGVCGLTAEGSERMPSSVELGN